MGMNIALGGVGADIGSAFGSKFTQGVGEGIDEEMERQKEIRSEERAKREEERQRKYADGVRAESRGFALEDRAEGREFAASERGRVQGEESAQALRTYKSRLEGQFAGKTAQDGEPMSQSQFDHEQLRRQALGSIGPGATLQDVSDSLYAVDEGLTALADQEDEREMMGAMGVLATPDENGVTMANEADLAALDAMMQNGQVEQFREGVALITEKSLNEVARQGLIESVAEVVGENVALWKEQPAPNHIVDGAERKEYSTWRQNQEGRLHRAVAEQQLLRRVQGGDYDPFAGEQAINAVIYELDPITRRKAKEQDLAEKREAMEAEERVKGIWGLAKSAEKASEFTEMATAADKAAGTQAKTAGSTGPGSPYIEPKPTNPSAIFPWYTAEVERLAGAGREADAAALMDELERKLAEMEAQQPKE